MMTSLILCQGLKAFLTSIYAMETKVLAVPSFGDVIHNNHIKIIVNFPLRGILKEYSFLKNRIPKNANYKVRRLNPNEIEQIKNGQAVILCSTQICKSKMIYSFNAHLPDAMTNDHIGLDFYTLIIPINHTYANEFHRL